VEIEWFSKVHSLSICAAVPILIFRFDNIGPCFGEQLYSSPNIAARVCASFIAPLLYLCAYDRLCEVQDNQETKNGIGLPAATIGGLPNHLT
jgi:hypothetical protein